MLSDYKLKNLRHCDGWFAGNGGKIISSQLELILTPLQCCLHVALIIILWAVTITDSNEILTF